MVALAGATAIAAGVLLAGPSAALAKPPSYPSITCAYGAIAGGSYASIKVTGDCWMDEESVFVYGNIDVKANAMLWTTTNMFLWVRGNINVGRNAVLALGCSEISCFIAPPPTSPSPLSFWAYVGGTVDADNALTVVLFGVNVVKNVEQDGGGGGCAPTAPVSIKDGSPFGVSVYFFNTIGGNLSIQHVNTCGIFVIENLINRNVNDNDNTTSCNLGLSTCVVAPASFAPTLTTPDTSNVIGGNWIGGNVNCRNNDPAPFQVENFIGGHATGQCVWVP
jgi:hypothetical protein